MAPMPTQAERDAAVRWRPGAAAAEGHVESLFLKANAPGTGRAFWLKFTIFAPAGRPADTVAEVWAIVFDRASGEHAAGKETFPIAGADLGNGASFRFAAGTSVLEPGATRGRVRAAGGRLIEWDLRFEALGPPMRLYPSDALYEIQAFPRIKQLSPYPVARFKGIIVVDGTPFDVDGWPGAIGHNWGRGHAFRYAWAQVNAFADAPPGTVFEGASAKLKLGPVETPYMSVMWLRYGAREFDFRGVRHWFNRSVEVARYRWSFVAEGPEARLAGRFEARPDDLVGLVYRDPDGKQAFCLNSKIASCRLELSERTRRGFSPVATLVSEDAAALELLVRETDHGIPIQA